jgi:hypothetical protein
MCHDGATKDHRRMGRENGVATDDSLPVVLGDCAVIWIVSYLFLRDEEKKK